MSFFFFLSSLAETYSGASANPYQGYPCKFHTVSLPLEASGVSSNVAEWVRSQEQEWSRDWSKPHSPSCIDTNIVLGGRGQKPSRGATLGIPIGGATKTEHAPACACFFCQPSMLSVSGAEWRLCSKIQVRSHLRTEYRHLKLCVEGGFKLHDGHSIPKLPPLHDRRRHEKLRIARSASPTPLPRCSHIALAARCQGLHPGRSTSVQRAGLLLFWSAPESCLGTRRSCHSITLQWYQLSLSPVRSTLVDKGCSLGRRPTMLVVCTVRVLVG